MADRSDDDDIGAAAADMLQKFVEVQQKLAESLRERNAQVKDLNSTVTALKQKVAELEQSLQEQAGRADGAQEVPALDLFKVKTIGSSPRSTGQVRSLSAGSPKQKRLVSPKSSGESAGSSARERLSLFREHGRNRLRSSSDDGSFFRTYSSLHRVCSYIEDDSGSDDADSKGGRESSVKATSRQDSGQVQEALQAHFNFEGSNKSPSREMQPLDEGVTNLDNFVIEPAPANTTQRGGYRLLTCNDDQCHMQKIESGLIRIPHLTKMLVKCKWLRMPRTVLIIKKPKEIACTRMMLKAALHFNDKGLAVIVENLVYNSYTTPDPSLVHDEQHSLHQQLRAVESVTGATDAQIADAPIDFCVCIGGDGTIIWTSHLFPKGCPPVVSIAMGSLGFLSTFTAAATMQALDGVLCKSMLLTLRSRLEVKIKRKGATQEESMEMATVLNEVVIDRGPNSSIVNLDLFIGNSMQTPITHVQGDGIIISTPTGSTAYSLSAGGSMIHPSIPCVVITPICPHSLSFRPIVVSDTATVRLRVSENARTSAYVSFDGRKPLEMKKGDEIQIRVSEFPVPCICNKGENEDWFESIKIGFMWNERTLQKKISLVNSEASSFL